MSEVLKQLFSNDKADELINAVNKLAPTDSGMSSTAKTALLNCFMKVAWVDDSGATLIQKLQTALFDGGADPEPEPEPTPVDDRIIYELTPGTDIYGKVINTNIGVPMYNENFTIIAKATLRKKTSGDTTASMLFGSGGLSETSKATIRACVDYSNGICKFVTNYMYADTYADESSSISMYEDHELTWVIRNDNSSVKKMLIVDGNRILNKTESVSAYSSRVKGANIILGSHMASQPASFNGVVSLFRIYNAAISDNEIETILA